MNYCPECGSNLNDGVSNPSHQCLVIKGVKYEGNISPLGVLFEKDIMEKAMDREREIAREVVTKIWEENLAMDQPDGTAGKLLDALAELIVDLTRKSVELGIRTSEECEHIIHGGMNASHRQSRYNYLIGFNEQVRDLMESQRLLDPLDENIYKQVCDIVSMVWDRGYELGEQHQ